MSRSVVSPSFVIIGTRRSAPSSIASPLYSAMPRNGLSGGQLVFTHAVKFIEKVRAVAGNLFGASQFGGMPMRSDRRYLCPHVPTDNVTGETSPQNAEFASQSTHFPEQAGEPYRAPFTNDGNTRKT